VSSKPRADGVIDSVVLHYFLLVDRAPLLLDLLGVPLRVPRLIFDPEDEPGTSPMAMSEMNRSIDYHRRRATDPSRLPPERKEAEQYAERLATIADLHARAELEIIDMTDDERALFGQLTSPTGVTEFGLHFPLDPGEAACLAIALRRGWVLATDDTDALKALARASTRHPYERIRKLLIRAATEDLVTRAEANEIHEAMTAAGFWDRGRQFR
jgi:hypothetical protein